MPYLTIKLHHNQFTFRETPVKKDSALKTLGKIYTIARRGYLPESPTDYFNIHEIAQNILTSFENSQKRESKFCLFFIKLLHLKTYHEKLLDLQNKIQLIATSDLANRIFLETVAKTSEDHTLPLIKKLPFDPVILTDEFMEDLLAKDAYLLLKELYISYKNSNPSLITYLMTKICEKSMNEMDNLEKQILSDLMINSKLNWKLILNKELINQLLVKDHIKILSKLIQLDLNPFSTFKSEPFGTLLHYLIFKNNGDDDYSKCLNYLLRNKVDPNQEFSGCYPIHQAIQSPSLTPFKLLCQAQTCDLFVKNTEGDTVFMALLKEYALDPQIIEQKLEIFFAHIPDPNGYALETSDQDHQGTLNYTYKSYLHLLIEHQVTNLEKVFFEPLRERKISVNLSLIDSQGQTPLLKAIKNSQESLVQFLINQMDRSILESDNYLLEAVRHHFSLETLKLINDKMDNDEIRFKTWQWLKNAFEQGDCSHLDSDYLVQCFSFLDIYPFDHYLKFIKLLKPFDLKNFKELTTLISPEVLKINIGRDSILETLLDSLQKASKETYPPLKILAKKVILLTNDRFILEKAKEVLLEYSLEKVDKFWEIDDLFNEIHKKIS